MLHPDVKNGLGCNGKGKKQLKALCGTEDELK